MALETLAEDLWSVESDVRLPGGARLPLRMTVVRLPTGELLLHSPVDVDGALESELFTLGKVAHLVAPSLLHHLHLAAWKQRQPAAQLHGPPGLAEKRPDLTFTAVLGDEAPPAWRGVLDQVLIQGAPALNEVAFFHRPSRTLLVADLLFNVRRPANLRTALVLTLMGTRGKLARSRAWNRFSRDRAAVRAAVARVAAWNADRLSVCHGQPLGPGAASEIARALGEFA